MEIKEIIQEASEFPSKDLGTLSIFIVLSILVGSFALSGIISLILGLKNPVSFIMGLLSLIISLLIGLVMSGYLISVIKSGIKHEENVPNFEWKENFYTGINNLAVTFVYYMIPTIIVLIISYLTNVHGTIIAVFDEINTQLYSIYLGSSTAYAFDAISRTITKVPDSLTIPIIAAIILFIIFAFLQTMAVGRLANTDDLMEALNIKEASKDITRIGTTKVVLLILSLVVVATVIEIIFSFLFNILPFLSILSIIISPYLMFFIQRAVGLLYSDIA